MEVIRPDDLVNLAIGGVNLRLDTSDASKPVLVVDDSASPAFLIVRFPPQSIAENAWFESAEINQADSGNVVPPAQPDVTPEKPLDPPGVVGGDRDANASSAHASRLVFRIPADARIPFDTAGILDWSSFEPSLNPIAAIPPSPSDEQIAGAPGLGPPGDTETALELPYRLLISPNGDAAWKSRASRFTASGRTELWHTRLVLEGGAYSGELTDEHTAPLRALWSPEYQPFHIGGPVPYLGDTTAMTADDRRQIVVLTSAFHGYDVDVELELPFPFDDVGTIDLTVTEPFVPQPFYAELLMLSALGGWLRSRGTWTPPYKAPPRRHIPDLHRVFGAIEAAPDVELHHAEAAAPVEHGVETPDKLDLSEWVHLASEGRDHYVRIVYEGKLLPHGHRASLVKVTERKFEEVGGIVGAYLMQHMYVVPRERERQFTLDDRGMPFKRVTLTTRVTPDIAKPDYVGSTSFWVDVRTTSGGRVPFLFHGVGQDVGDNPVDFTVPMMFVSDAEDQLATVYAAYNAGTKLLPDPSARAARVPGQKVLFAKAAGNDNTRLATDSLTFDVDTSDGHPSLSQAAVHIPQVQELLGTDASTTISLYGPYVTSDFDAGAGVFATVDKLDVEFQAQKAGGFATPNLDVNLLSRARGPIAGTAADAENDHFDPTSFFGKGVGELFGTFDLTELLLSGPLAGSAPIMATTTNDDGAGGKLVETTIDWTPPSLHESASGVAKFTPQADSTLTVHGLIQKRLPASGADPAAGAPTFSFTGTLTNFDVTILDVEVKFQSFAFSAKNGGKPNIDVSLQSPPMDFTGDLKFVDDLTSAIPPGLFGDGPSIDLVDQPLGVRAGFAVALPPIEVGVFALSDVALGAALTLPFLDGKPVLDFNVSRRDHPFLVAVAIFGGGGFFHMQVDTAGMKELEAALEFGATASIDIGVASGGVHMMAGIYFSLQRKNGGDLASTLSGYLRMGGSLSVLGLITVSVEFNLTFTYDSGQDKAYGRATLTVEVDVAFFSKSVELTVERGFGGSGDPKFGDLFTTPAIWSEYALAFA